MNYRKSTLIRAGIALFFCLYTTVTQAQTVHQIFVSTSGNASAAGTEIQPVDNIVNALKLAESTSKSGVSKIEIILRGGTYYLDKTVEIIQGKTWNSSVPLSIE